MPPPDMTEELGLEQRGRQRGEADGDQRTGAAWPQGVQRAGRPALSGPALPEQQHGRIRSRGGEEALSQALKSVTSPYQKVT